MIFENFAVIPSKKLTFNKIRREYLREFLKAMDGMRPLQALEHPTAKNNVTDKAYY